MRITINDLIKTNELEFKENYFYNYILLKKSILGNIRNVGTKSLLDMGNVIRCFVIFLQAIIYIGKGTRKRDFDHVKGSIISLLEDDDNFDDKSDKLKECMIELANGDGIVIVRAYPDSNHYLAHSREAALIKGVGLDNITNKVHGHFYGADQGWTDIKMENYGLLLAYTFFKSYMNDGSEGYTFEDLCNNIFHKPRKEEDSFEGKVECCHNQLKCNGCSRIFK